MVLDTFHDKRNGFLFYVTPVGGMFDGATTDERINNADWNTVWQAKVSRFDGGWMAEIAIPFKSLRYGPGREQIWGINLRRTIRAKNEYAYITPLKRSWGIIALFRDLGRRDAGRPRGAAARRRTSRSSRRRSPASRPTCWRRRRSATTSTPTSAST